MKREIILIALCSCGLTGCGTLNHMRSQVLFAERGIAPELEAASVKQSIDQQSEVLSLLQRSAGHPFGTVDQNLDIFYAGANYIDGQCYRYIGALESYNKYLERTKGYVTNMATATGVILAAAEASTTAIGITAASFGLASDSIEVTKNTLLTDIEPSGLVSLISQQQSAYVSDLINNRSVRLSSEASTTRAIRGYLQNCLPSNIRSLVNEAVKSAKVDVVNGVTFVRPSNTVEGNTENILDEAVSDK